MTKKRSGGAGGEQEEIRLGWRSGVGIEMTSPEYMTLSLVAGYGAAYCVPRGTKPLGCSLFIVHSIVHCSSFGVCHHNHHESQGMHMTDNLGGLHFHGANGLRVCHRASRSDDSPTSCCELSTEKGAVAYRRRGKCGGGNVDTIPLEHNGSESSIGFLFALRTSSFTSAVTRSR